MLEWDQAAIMPSGGGESRAEALGTLQELRHELATAPELADWIEGSEAEALGDWKRANVRELKRAWERNTRLPSRLVGARARARSRGHGVWIAARPKNDWASFLPALREIVDLEREAAQILSDHFGCSPYDALLDAYEPGVGSAEIDPLFDALREFLPGFIPVAVERARERQAIVPRGPFPVEAQRTLGLELMKAIGFDFEHGRLDVSAHPFCGGVPSDVRITTRYDESDFSSALMGVLHETGHAKYEQGLPRAWLEQPVGAARSMSFHESQSLLQEMQISRSSAFLQFAVDAIHRAFPEAVAAQSEAFTLENLAKLYTHVEATKIRVDADEVTYPCHVMLRYDIERELIAGTIRVDEIPDVWDTAMHALLGLDTRGDFRDGCMQDIHWAAGAIGYFPTYTLGAMRAAQIFAAAREALPDVDTRMAGGDFEALNDWLRERVWGCGSLLEGEELMRHATGRALDAKPFIEHLERRYGA